MDAIVQNLLCDIMFLVKSDSISKCQITGKGNDI